MSSTPVGSWQPTTSGNHLTGEGGVVVKRHGSRLTSCVREGELLARLRARGAQSPNENLQPGRGSRDSRSARRSRGPLCRLALVLASVRVLLAN